MNRDQYIKYIESVIADLFEKVCTQPNAVKAEWDGNGDPVLVRVSVAATDKDNDVFIAAQTIIEKVGEINGFSTVLQSA